MRYTGRRARRTRGHGAAISIYGEAKGRMRAPGTPDRFAMDPASEVKPMSEEQDGSLKILVVDDNEDMRSMLAYWLEGRGYHVTQAVNGQLAAETALRERPDIVLMDISMPHLDGFAATRRMRAEEELRGVPIIAVSALVMEDVSGAALAAGCTEFIPKPIDYHRLENVLSGLLSRKIDETDV